MENIIVVTRHPALVALLQERGEIVDGVEVIAHVDDPEILRGRVVYGVLPMHLAAVADEMREVPLKLSYPEMRGRELSLEEIRSIAGPTRRYRVVEVRTVRSILNEEGTVGIFDGNSLGRLVLADAAHESLVLEWMADEGGCPVVLRASGPARGPVLDAIVDDSAFFKALGVEWTIVPWWAIESLAQAAVEAARLDYYRTDGE